MIASSVRISQDSVDEGCAPSSSTRDEAGGVVGERGARAAEEGEADGERAGTREEAAARSGELLEYLGAHLTISSAAWRIAATMRLCAPHRHR